MKYVIIVLSVIVFITFFGYQYFQWKLIDLQESSYKEMSQMDIEESPRTFPDSLKITEEQFWSLIEHSKMQFPNDFESQMSVLIDELSLLEDSKIIGFEMVLREKVIELLDFKIKSFYQILFGNYVSTDAFLYFRFWIISNGEKFMKESLNSPDNLANSIYKTFEGETLLVVADFAFDKKNGIGNNKERPRDAAYLIDYDLGKYKMTGNYIDPANFDKIFPNLVAKF